jgi:hypothetical protein
MPDFYDTLQKILAICPAMSVGMVLASGDGNSTCGIAIPPQEAILKAYIEQLNRAVEEENRRREACKLSQTQAASAAAREKLAPLDTRVARLLAAVPPEVQCEGLSLQAVQIQLRGRGRGHSRCHVGELGDAMRRLGFRRERRWQGGADGFRALWYPPRQQ